MSNQPPAPNAQTAMPMIAGIIDIIVGAGSLLATLGVGIAVLVVSTVAVPVLGLLVPLVGIPALALGTVAVVGGVFATQKRNWGWALAGSICAAIVSNVLGIAAIILIAISRAEFQD